MTNIEITFKNGETLSVQCEEFSVEFQAGKIVGIKYDGLIKPKKLLYINMPKIQSIIQT